jgi:hypothetical protein
MAFRLQHKEFIRYPDQAFTKRLAGVAMQNDYHFLLQLKSIKRYNTKTGKLIPFNSFSVDEIKQLEDLIKLPAVIRGKSKIDFHYYLKRCLKMEWISEYGINYNLKSLNKINQELGFQTYTNKNGITYYSYRRLLNVQGIDLQAHRIHQIIQIKEKQFKYELRNNPKEFSQNSRTAVNRKLIASFSKKKSKVSCSADYFGIAISTIRQIGGYEGNAFVWEKLNHMQKQGFKIKKDKSLFDKHKKRDCNLYQTYFDGVFKTIVESKVKTVDVLNETEIKFKNLLNNTKFRIASVNAGIMSNSYLKFTKQNELVKIPVRSWSNMLVKMLNNSDFKSYLLRFIEPEKIRISQREKSARFKTITFESPYGTVNIHHATLVDRHGNYDSYANEVLKEYKSEIEKTNRNIITNNSIRIYKPMQEGYLLPNPLCIPI